LSTDSSPPPKKDEALESTTATEAELLTYRYFSQQFERQIKAQKTNVLISSGFAVAVLIVGIIATFLLYRSPGLKGSALEYIKLSPTALSSIGLPFPLKSYLQYRTRMPIYTGYKQLFDEAIETRTRIDPKLIEAALEALKPLQKVD
jgi:hypothetical protein